MLFYLQTVQDCFITGISDIVYRHSTIVQASLESKVWVISLVWMFLKHALLKLITLNYNDWKAVLPQVGWDVRPKNQAQWRQRESCRFFLDTGNKINCFKTYNTFFVLLKKTGQIIFMTVKWRFVSSLISYLRIFQRPATNQTTLLLRELELTISNCQ